jgi:acetyltransferase-like isoleucine patch superfamily enzyme
MTARGATSVLRARLWALRHRNVRVGTRARVGRNCRLIIARGATLVLGDGCTIDDGTTVAVYGSGRVVLGAGSFVGHHCTIAAHESVEVGAGAFLAELVSVRDHDHVVGAPPSSGRVDVAPVSIGADAWLGAKVTVVRGSSIGAGTVVGANAVVRGDVPAHTVAGGIPARVLRSLEVPA